VELPVYRVTLHHWGFHRSGRYHPKDVDEWLDKELERRADIALSLHPPQNLKIKDEVVSYLRPRLKLWINQGGRSLPDTEQFPGM
jgi:hypothetical protein